MKSLLRKFTRRLTIVHQLPKPVSYWLLVRLACFAALVPLLMRLKLPYAARLVTPRRPAAAPDPLAIEQLIVCTDAVLQLGRPLLQVRCLTRGVTLYHFLRRLGLDVELHFGVRYDQDLFTAHCWLVKDSEPFAEVHDPRPIFTPTYKFPVTEMPSIRPQSEISAALHRASN